MIYLRPATMEELPLIMQIFTEAKALLKADGSSQWQSGSPNEETFKADIAANEGYVLIVDGQVGGYLALKAGIDPNYLVIREGSWHLQEDYLAIHRVMISSQFRGKKLASYLFSDLLSLAYAQNKFYLRIDTHPKNNRMQHLIKKAGFDYCGLIEISGDPDPDRYAYDLKLGGR